ncbi:MAG: DUF2975 domain-containing protein [Chloroflexi bacterium]|nr:DUF2975 domain-containing protein [Chloroflexota bacterium]
MDRLAVRLLRVALVVLLLGSVLAQVLVPMYGTMEESSFPALAYLVLPYSVAGILVIACGQVALLVVWRLLSLIEGGVIFTRSALRWVDAITACGAVATALSAGALVHLLAFVGAHNATLVAALAVVLAGGLAFVLLTVVMRGLLESAIAARTELDEVI